MGQRGVGPVTGRLWRAQKAQKDCHTDRAGARERDEPPTDLVCILATDVALERAARTPATTPFAQMRARGRSRAGVDVDSLRLVAGLRRRGATVDWCHDDAVKVAGTRHIDTSPMADQAALARPTALLRGTAHLVPRGVYRFSSFEEADVWMTRMMLRTHAHPSRRTSSASVAT